MIPDSVYRNASKRAIQAIERWKKDMGYTESTLLYEHVLGLYKHFNAERDIDQEEYREHLIETDFVTIKWDGPDLYIAMFEDAWKAADKQEYLKELEDKGVFPKSESFLTKLKSAFIRSSERS